MIRMTLEGYVDYEPNSKGWGVKNIYIICDAGDIINVEGKIMPTIK